jgi:hypothetical protein
VCNGTAVRNVNETVSTPGAKNSQASGHARARELGKKAFFFANHSLLPPHTVQESNTHTWASQARHDTPSTRSRNITTAAHDGCADRTLTPQSVRP